MEEKMGKTIVTHEEKDIAKRLLEEYHDFPLAGASRVPYLTYMVQVST